MLDPVTMSALLGAIGLSFWDRAGVPLAFLGGLAALGAEWAPALYLGCALSGLLGDALAYEVGARLLRRPPAPSAFAELRAASAGGLAARVLEWARFVDAAPRRWLLASRAFPAINQLVPLAVGARGLASRGEALAACALGNALWFGAWWAAYGAFGALTLGWGGPARVALGAGAAVAVGWGLSRAGRAARGG